MDFQHRPGGKTGSGGVASSSESNRDRRERLRQLALETIDINKDPYFMKNHLGSYECKLCLTLHNNEGSYLAHTQGKKHQTNLARRAAKEAKEAPAQPAPEKVKVEVKKFVKIGRPGYKVTKQRDAEVGQQSLLFQIDYPEIAESSLTKPFLLRYQVEKLIKLRGSFGPTGIEKQNSFSFSSILRWKNLCNHRACLLDHLE
ncbi:hypothetical protein scyTo_0002631 [Scyliorhinus torazame]|uniref:Matrin-type domain-containing protein n=1 Tax=Scyliorhinus torazame TaxID=75743 RepID=A0A401PKA2_SCYTO|nr:hypothetical protein [Scyliorhinus torazame]